MTVTALRRRRGNIFAVFSGSEQIALLDEKTIDEHGIRAGVSLSESEIELLSEESAGRQALTRGLEIIARREVCRSDMCKRLEKDYGDDAAQFAADELERLGLINDRRFAVMLAEQLYEVKHYYTRRVCYELVGKGVDRDLAQEVCQEIEPDQTQALELLLSGRLGRELGDERGRRRVINTLIRYGYEAGEIYSAINCITEE